MKTIFGAVLPVLALLFFMGCKQEYPKPKPFHGKPVLIWDEPVYDKNTKTFSLVLSTDSTDDATVTYYLIDVDSIIMQNGDGKFVGILPLDDGYDIQACAEWPDTSIKTSLIHILGFVVPKDPVEKMPLEEVQRLINTMDEDMRQCNLPQLAQGVKVVTIDSKLSVQTIQEVMMNLKYKKWESVVVKEVTYNDDNLITSVTLKPIGEIIEDIDFEDEEIY